MKKTPAWLSMLILPSLAGAPTHAGEAPAAYTTPDYIRRAPTLPPGRNMDRAMRLSLAETVETCLRRNLTINLSRQSVVQAELARDQAWGQFEPLLFGGTQHSDSRAPPQTRQEGSAGEVLSFKGNGWNLGVSQPLPTGGTFAFRFASDFSESMLGTAVLPKLVRSSFTMSVSQPLLRGFSLDGRVQLGPVLLARFASERALEEARLSAMNVIIAAESTYWNLVRTIKSYEVTAGALELAQRQLEITQRQIAAGTIPGSELISVESTLAQRQLALVRAETAIEQVSDGLRMSLNLPPEEWSRAIVPVDVPRFLPLQVAEASAIEHALVTRPELKSANIDLKRVALSLNLSRNDRLPRLDLQASYNTVGQDERFSPSFNQLTGGESRVFGVGLSFGWAPLGVAARAQIHQLESVLRGSEITHEQAALNIRRDVRQAVRNIEMADRQLRAAAHSRELSERSLDVEQRRFISGLSDNFKIAGLQAQLEQARQAELDALIQHETSASDLQFAMGDLLEARRLRFSTGR